jgi:hypothetical protein
MTFDTVTAIIRMGPEHKKLGDPFDFSCTVVKAGDTAFIYSGVGELNKDRMREIGRELKRQGFKFVEWVRIKDHGLKTMRIKLSEALLD